MKPLLNDEMRKEIAYMRLVEGYPVGKIIEIIQNKYGDHITEAVIKRFCYHKLPRVEGRSYTESSRNMRIQQQIDSQVHKLIIMLKEDKKCQEEVKKLKEIIVELNKELESYREIANLDIG